jgi:hypothetical protein
MASPFDVGPASSVMLRSGVVSSEWNLNRLAPAVHQTGGFEDLQVLRDGLARRAQAVLAGEAGAEFEQCLIVVLRSLSMIARRVGLREPVYTSPTWKNRQV